ncbi:MAG: hypothetical protein KGD74_02425 [Candidatus Lokiarchaeota archaeon]|nr:hypothetical protein [Candidatus Lokiarchaeota archaeon]
MNKLHKNYWGLLGEWLIGFNSKISRVNCFTSDGKYLITSENTGGKIEHWVYDLEKKKNKKTF